MTGGGVLYAAAAPEELFVVEQASGTAVVLVDLQNDFCHADGVFSRAGLQIANLEPLVESVNLLTAAARGADVPVVWVTTQWNSDADVGLLRTRSPFLAREGLRRGTWGADLLDGLNVSQEDWRLEKRRFSAFYGTDLEARLRGAGVGRLVIGGVRTDFCVESTVRDAFFRDFDVLVVREAVAGYFEDFHEHSLRLMGTVFSRVVALGDAIEAFGRDADPVTAGSSGA